MRVSYRYVVDGNEIVVLDDCFSAGEKRAISRMLAAGPYRREDAPHRGRDRPLRVRYDPEAIRDSPWGGSLEAAVKAAFPKETFCLRSVHGQVEVYGDLAATLRDAKRRSSDVTAIAGGNRRWDLDWGGEALFYDRRGDCQYAIDLKPGRVILFRSALRYRTNVVNRECVVPRLLLVAKLRAATGRSRSRASPRRRKAISGAPRRLAA